MKAVYWKREGPSRWALVLIALVSIAALVAVEHFRRLAREPWQEEKLAAARLALDAFEVVKSERLARGIPIDREADPQETGLIGRAFSPVTSNSGSISAKRASVNPNFAALVVDYLKRAGVERGDTVAVGVSGSFPALAIATYAALETLALEPIVVASASASEWGANEPGFMWLDMEKVLAEKKLFRIRATAASRGGIDDYGASMSPESLELIDAAIARSGVERLDARSLSEGIDLRTELYSRKAGNRSIKAYINIGGGTASVGTHVGKKQFKPGLNREPPRGASVDSVMLRFLRRGVPVIHLTAVEELAEKHGFLPADAGRPRIGEGTIYVKEEYNPWIAFGGLVLIVGSMLALLRLDLARKDRASPSPEHLI
jgi:poly-gamma-glutamate system protein